MSCSWPAVGANTAREQQVHSPGCLAPRLSSSGPKGCPQVTGCSRPALSTPHTMRGGLKGRRPAASALSQSSPECHCEPFTELRTSSARQSPGHVGDRFPSTAQDRHRKKPLPRDDRTPTGFTFPSYFGTALSPASRITYHHPTSPTHGVRRPARPGCGCERGVSSG